VFSLFAPTTAWKALWVDVIDYTFVDALPPWIVKILHTFEREIRFNE